MKEEQRKVAEVRRRRRNDIILVAVILLLAAAGIAIFLLARESGERVVVMLDGEVFAEYSLSDSVTAEIPSGIEGKNRNRLVIADGKAWVSEADCPDLICARHKPISHEGETIVCIPNRLVISIE